MLLLHHDLARQLAADRHRELVAAADAYRLAARTGDPQPDCRIPADAGGPACRPDPRPAAAGRIGRRRPRLGLRGHRGRRRVR